MNITYKVNEPVTADQFIEILLKSSLGERRPIQDRKCIEGMVANSDLTVSAWSGSELIGIARSITDFHYACYLSDLAVDIDFQSQGIGRQLQALTQSQLGPHCKLILLAAPSADSYYPHIGFSQHRACWILERDKKIL